MQRFSNVKRQAQMGFTLLEVLLVVAIISILAGIVIIAINPSKNLADARDAQRQLDVTTILDATYQYYLDNGSLPASITTTPKEVCITSSCSSLADLTPLTNSGKYLVSIPKDPSCPTGCTPTNGGGYTIAKDVNNRATVAAPGAENKTISVTR